MALRYQVRRGTAAEWVSENPVLRSGEMGLETDTQKLKIGDGATAWVSLAYLCDGGEYVQAIPSSVWTVNHNLGRYPVAKVLNTAGQELLCSIEHTSVNQLVVTHKTSIAGRVVW